MTLGSVLKEARNRKGMSLREVARETGISNGYVSLIESDRVKTPSTMHLHALATLYGISHGLLLELAGHAMPKALEVAFGEPDLGLTDLSEFERDQVRAFAGYLRASRKGAP